MHYRSGIGYDIHRLVGGRPLVLGGVRIPFEKGLLGHSDADALIHAVCDAILGALSMGDIGEHFPDSDPAYKDADSGRLLAQVKAMLDSSGYEICNIDTVIIAQAPAISPFKKEIKGRLCSLLAIDEGVLNIKAKTNEGLDSVGSCEAIACYAVVSLVKP